MNPSAINCGGFFDVNRNLFKSVGLITPSRWMRYYNHILHRLQLLTTMVTYLVVLLQFQISIPDDASTYHNMLNVSAPLNATLSSK